MGRENGILLVATDGHRLSLAEASCEIKGLKTEQRFVIPRKALVELKKVIELGSRSVTVEAKDNHIFFRLDDRTVISRAVEDQFPDYEKVVPQSNDKKIMFATAELEAAVRRVALLAPEKAGVVKLAFADGTLSFRRPTQKSARPARNSPAISHTRRSKLGLTPNMYSISLA